MPLLAIIALLLGHAPAWAGVVQGAVVDMQSGYPLARSRVRLDRVDASGKTNAGTQLTNRTGTFAFPNVPDGLYVLSVSRDAYATTFHGQRRPGGAGRPFSVARDTNLFAEIRLRRLAVLTGRVLDENSVGIRGVPVLAYPYQPATAPAGDRNLRRSRFLPFA